MRRVICVYLPRWPTDRLRRRLAVPPETPLLTVARQGPRRMVMAVDAQAARMGLRAGMAVAQAQALVPELRIEEADPAGDTAALKTLTAWCLRHLSPLAAPCPPDALWIDVAGCTHLFGGEGPMLEMILHRLAKTGFAARAAMAETQGAAHALARFGPDISTIVAGGGVRAALAGLPPAALRLDEETVQGLLRLGFSSIGQLAETPRAPLSRRFGGVVLRRLDEALGAAPEPIEPMHFSEIPRTRQGFAEPISTAEDIGRAIGLLVDSLCGKLERAGLGASRLDLVCQRIDGSAHMARIGTHAATREAAHLARLLMAGVEKIDPGFGIERMSLAASVTDRLGARQSFSEFLAEGAAPDLSGLVDVLANRLGGGAIYRMRPVESDIAERSVQRVSPLAAAEGVGWPDRLPRPARLFTPPWPIDAVALLPDQAPVHFIWRRVRHRVRKADGPERVFGEWWAHEAEVCAVRDYFQLEDEAGQRFWVFRNGDGEDGATGDLQWFLHGLFG